MAGLFKRILIVGYFRVELFGLILYFGLDFPRIQPGTFQRAGKVVSLVPVRLSAPDQLSCLVGKGDAPALPRCRLAHAGHTADIRLLRGNFTRCGVLHDRIGPRRSEWDVMELRHPHHVADRITQPVGVVLLEEVRLPDGKGIDRP